MASKIIVDQLQKTTGGLAALTLPVANASANEFLQNNGSGALSWAASTGGLAGMKVYTTASSTWTKSVREAALGGVTIVKVIVEVQGGGAGGGRDSAGTEQIGGSAGGYARRLLDVTGVTSATVSVGVAGAGATGDNTAGADGGDSSWVDGINTPDTKGLKGVGGNTANTRTIGGLGTGGDLNIQGGNGGKQITGQAGSSQFGHGGQNWSVVASQNDATGYGAGGGSMETSGGNGGAGTQGIVIVYEYT
jgi:hypothetical protein